MADVKFFRAPSGQQPARVMIQCSHPVADLAWDPNWRLRRYQGSGRDPSKCQRDAVVEIDGQALCGLHGGKVALRLLYEQNKEKG